MGNGFRYLYQAWDPSIPYFSKEFGYFSLGDPTVSETNPDRFRYDYGSGQWYHIGADAGLGWHELGTSGLSAAFPGISGYVGGYDLGNGFRYIYLAEGDFGIFSIGFMSFEQKTFRFRYDYLDGQWYHIGAHATLGWQPLGTSGLSSLFPGSHQNQWWYNLYNGFYYLYLADEDCGTFYRGDPYIASWGGMEFRYDYTHGQWYHSGVGGPSTSGWEPLGASGLGAAFPGSGLWCNLGLWYGLNWFYKYDADDISPFHDDFGIFALRTESDYYVRFAYGYQSGDWEHAGNDGARSLLGVGGYSAVFIGDGFRHDLGDWHGAAWRYIYNFEEDSGKFERNFGARFSYRYANGQWSHPGFGGEWEAIGPERQSSAFIGDTAPHDLGTWLLAHWWFTYDLTLDSGVFSVNSSSGKRFSFAYNACLWSFWQTENYGWTSLGWGSQSSTFIGDGAGHVFDPEYYWEMRYNIELNEMWIHKVDHFPSVSYVAYRFGDQTWYDSQFNEYNQQVTSLMSDYWLVASNNSQFLTFKKTGAEWTMAYQLPNITDEARWAFYSNSLLGYVVYRYDYYTWLWEWWNPTKSVWEYWGYGPAGLHRP